MKAATTFTAKMIAIFAAALIVLCVVATDAFAASYVSSSNTATVSVGEPEGKPAEVLPASEMPVVVIDEQEGKAPVKVSDVNTNTQKKANTNSNLKGSTEVEVAQEIEVAPVAETAATTVEVATTAAPAKAEVEVVEVVEDQVEVADEAEAPVATQTASKATVNLNAADEGRTLAQTADNGISLVPVAAAVVAVAAVGITFGLKKAAC